MAIGRAEGRDIPPQRVVECKVYHRPKGSESAGKVRDRYDAKSQCPSWAADLPLQRALINEALEDTKGLLDFSGRPKKLWNAVDGWTFVAVSCNTTAPRYNCYPCHPPDGKLLAELRRRSERTREDVLRLSGGQ